MFRSIPLGPVGVIALVLAVAGDAHATPPNLSITLDSIDLDHQTGTVTLAGTVTCDQPIVSSEVDATVIQPVGRKGQVEGGNFADGFLCDPSSGPGPWSVTVFPAAGGKFSGGGATIQLSYLGLNASGERNVAFVSLSRNLAKH